MTTGTEGMHPTPSISGRERIALVLQIMICLWIGQSFCMSLPFELTTRFILTGVVALVNASILIWLRQKPVVGSALIGLWFGMAGAMYATGVWQVPVLLIELLS